jgi:hypothetical protein
MTPDEIDIYGFKSLKPEQYKKARCFENQKEITSAEELGHFIQIRVVRPI